MNDNLTFRTLGNSTLVEEGGVWPFYLEDLKRRVTVARVSGLLYAFDDLCTHDNLPLSFGLLTGQTIMCQGDGSEFSIASGEVQKGPAFAPQRMYPVREVDGVIEVSVSE
jgi:3-phenylpropionate/trans-cinnamate dioxygenase ferredoxin subunit